MCVLTQRCERWGVILVPERRLKARHRALGGTHARRYFFLSQSGLLAGLDQLTQRRVFLFQRIPSVLKARTVHGLVKLRLDVERYRIEWIVIHD